MAEIYADYLVWCASEAQYRGAQLSEQNRAFVALGSDVRCDGEFFVALLRYFDRDLYWHYVNANRDPKVIKQLLLDPALLPGFNDSGAHVTNMTYYDGNLRALRIGLQESEALFSTMLRRLTSEPAEFGCEQLVNRSPGVVAATFVAGQQLWDGHNFSASFGLKGAGGALTVSNLAS